MKIKNHKEKVLIRAFIKLYHDGHPRPWRNNHWLGIKTYKPPTDLFVYQEIITETAPDLIVELGSADGGTALFFASVMELLGLEGQVVSVDINPVRSLSTVPWAVKRIEDQKVVFLRGYSTEDRIFHEIRDLAAEKNKVMVVLDSAHDRQHVLKEMVLYSQLVTPGMYLVVEDTHEEGSSKAISDFLFQKGNKFVRDHNREKHWLTFIEGGFLKRLD